ncbi:hypothetical protein [Pseudomonas bharatica]|uniref:hypothetical protein n=1 Tax=Pseudomonas bharatica TaxID=2692112 RepID=UPI003B2864B0
MSSPGVRFERLLFWTAPITLATCAVFITTLGYNTIDERIKSKCYQAASEVLKASKKLPELWAEYSRSKSDDYGRSGRAYSSEIAEIIIFKAPVMCWGKYITRSDFETPKSPDEITKKLQDDAHTINSKPLSMYGIEIPDRANLSLMGNKVQVLMSNLIQALQIALAPILLLWLGSIYHTRLRETYLYKFKESISDVHPHVINVYPIGHYPDLRKRNFIKQYTPLIVSTVLISIRWVLLSIFLLPPTAFYLASLIFQPIFGHWELNLVTGFIIGMYFLCCYLPETLVFDKHFHGPAPLR